MFLQKNFTWYDTSKVENKGIIEKYKSCKLAQKSKNTLIDYLGRKKSRILQN